MIVGRPGLAGVLFEHGQAVMGLEELWVGIDRLLVVAAGRVEVAFSEVGRADTRVLKAGLGCRACFLPEVAARAGSPRCRRG